MRSWIASSCLLQLAGILCSMTSQQAFEMPCPDIYRFCHFSFTSVSDHSGNITISNNWGPFMSSPQNDGNTDCHVLRRTTSLESEESHELMSGCYLQFTYSWDDSKNSSWNSGMLPGMSCSSLKSKKDFKILWKTNSSCFEQYYICYSETREAPETESRNMTPFYTSSSTAEAVSRVTTSAVRRTVASGSSVEIESVRPPLVQATARSPQTDNGLFNSSVMHIVSVTPTAIVDTDPGLGLEIGLAVGCFLLLAVVIVLIYWLCLRRQRRIRREESKKGILQHYPVVFPDFELPMYIASYKQPVVMNNLATLPRSPSSVSSTGEYATIMDNPTTQPSVSHPQSTKSSDQPPTYAVVGPRSHATFPPIASSEIDQTAPTYAAVGPRSKTTSAPLTDDYEKAEPYIATPAALDRKTDIESNPACGPIIVDNDLYISNQFEARRSENELRNQPINNDAILIENELYK